MCAVQGYLMYAIHMFHMQIHAKCSPQDVFNCVPHEFCWSNSIYWLFNFHINRHWGIIHSLFFHSHLRLSQLWIEKINLKIPYCTFLVTSTVSHCTPLYIPLYRTLTSTVRHGTIHLKDEIFLNIFSVILISIFLDNQIYAAFMLNY